MMEQILNLVKDQVIPVIAGNGNIPDDKKEAVVETTTSSLLDGLKSNLIPDNLTELMGMFSGNGGGVSSLANSAMVKGVETTVVSALTEKVGLNKGIAATIASAVVPTVINMFSQKASDGDSAFSIESLVKAFAGGSGNSGAGGLMGMLGGLFGGK